jgi:hypothetical protein
LKKLLIIFIFLINLTQAGEYFFKEGDTILLSYGDSYSLLSNGESSVDYKIDLSYLISFEKLPIFFKLGLSSYKKADFTLNLLKIPTIRRLLLIIN